MATRSNYPLVVASYTDTNATYNPAPVPGRSIDDLLRRSPIRRDATGRVIDTGTVPPLPTPPNVHNDTTEPDEPDADSLFSAGFYLGEIFIPYWLPLAALGLYLVVKK